jgi:membrane associated rhomboid family serine protease
LYYPSAIEIGYAAYNQRLHIVRTFLLFYMMFGFSQATNLKIGGKVIATILASFTLADIFENELDSNYTILALSSINLCGAVLFHKGVASRHAQLLAKCQQSLLLSSIVHTDRSHFLTNTAILSLIWNDSCKLFGTEKSLAMYTSGASLSAATSKIINKSRPLTLTVGSSGAISTILAAVLWYRDVGPVHAPAGSVALMVTTMALLKLNIVSQVDHANHLAGLAFGTVTANIYKKV